MILVNNCPIISQRIDNSLHRKFDLTWYFANDDDDDVENVEMSNATYSGPSYEQLPIEVKKLLVITHIYRRLVAINVITATSFN